MNRRLVLASRNIGIGHRGLTKFAGVMNMLPPMNENSYRYLVSAVRNAAEIFNQSNCILYERTFNTFIVSFEKAQFMTVLEYVPENGSLHSCKRVLQACKILTP